MVEQPRVEFLRTATPLALIVALGIPPLVLAGLQILLMTQTLLRMMTMMTLVMTILTMTIIIVTPPLLVWMEILLL